MSAVQKWLRDPTTINGLGVAAGVIAGAVAHALSGSGGWALALGASATALLHVVMPSQSQFPTDVGVLVQDVARAAIEKRLAAQLPTLAEEGLRAIAALSPPAPPPAEKS